MHRVATSLAPLSLPLFVVLFAATTAVAARADESTDAALPPAQVVPASSVWVESSGATQSRLARHEPMAWTQASTTEFAFDPSPSGTSVPVDSDMREWATPGPGASQADASAPQEGASGGGSSDSLAKSIQNPLAALISVPFQGNIDFGIGSAGAHRYAMNVQPVIPISLSSRWNIISRTIIPIVRTEAATPTSYGTAGLGDVVQSFFLSPKDSRGGPIWGAGPVFLLPTATDDPLGAGKWGIGPTAVILKQECGWTYGALANHIWTVGGDDDRPDVNATYLQPFISYTFPSAFGIGLNMESTYDWERSQWTVPINLTFTQVTKICNQPISLLAGVRYYAEKPAGGPEWGLRLGVTFLFPKK
jgi:hypothetical protein